MRRSVSWLLGGLAVLICVLSPSPLAATATATSSGTATLTIDVLDMPGGNSIPPPAGLIVNPQATMDFQTVFDQSGVSNVTLNGSATLTGTGASARIDLATDTLSTADPIGRAHGAERALARIEFVNNTAQTVHLQTTTAYGISSSSTVGNAAVETSQAFIVLDITQTNIACLATDVLDKTLTTTAPPNDIPAVEAGTNIFPFSVPVGETCVVFTSLQTGAVAEAAAAAPALSLWMLVLLGLLLVGGGALLLRSFQPPDEGRVAAALD